MKGQTHYMINGNRFCLEHGRIKDFFPWAEKRPNKKTWFVRQLIDTPSGEIWDVLGLFDRRRDAETAMGAVDAAL